MSSARAKLTLSTFWSCHDAARSDAQIVELCVSLSWRKQNICLQNILVTLVAATWLQTWLSKSAVPHFCRDDLS
jgi:hypothetical protein